MPSKPTHDVWVELAGTGLDPWAPPPRWLFDAYREGRPDAAGALWNVADPVSSEADRVDGACFCTGDNRVERPGRVVTSGPTAVVFESIARPGHPGDPRFYVGSCPRCGKVRFAEASSPEAASQGSGGRQISASAVRSDAGRGGSA